MERPTKLYYKIGEACKALDIQPYVLRYWETEFPSLNPTKSKSGQRVYTDQELEIIRRIKQLLYEEGYTIAGAKKRLESELAGLVEPDAEHTDVTESQPQGRAAKKARSKAAVVESLTLPLSRPGAPRVSRTWRASAERALRDARELLALLDRPTRRS